MKVTQEVADLYTALDKEAVEMCKESGPEVLKQYMVARSLKGDPSFTEGVASTMLVKVLHGQELDAIERFWLVNMLGRLADVPAAARAVAGKPGKGKPKNGYAGMTRAWNVYEALFDGGAKSVEQAWGMVADARCVGSDTVKKDWIEWKPVLADVFTEAGKIYGFSTFDEAIKAYIQTNKGK